MPRIVSIEGNIASGKSTLLEQMRNFYKTTAKIAFVPEPVDQWRAVQDERGEDMLTKFYADPKRYSFAFQMMAYISRLSLLRAALRSGASVVVTERSVLTDRNVFASMLKEDGSLEEVEYQIYTRWFDEFTEGIPKPEIVYVRTDPATCLARAAIRGRKGETIAGSYLQKVHDKHEAWLLGADSDHRMLTLNANADTTAAPQVVVAWLQEIQAFIWPTASPSEGIGDGQIAPSQSVERACRSGWLLQSDGASRGNPGRCGAGWVLYHDGAVVSEGSQYLSDRGTNNWAEYHALLGGLVNVQQKCPRFGCEPLVVETDSLLVANQVRGDWDVKTDSLKSLRDDIVEAIGRIGRVQIVHIPREQNKHADRLANRAIDVHIANQPRMHN